MSLPKAVQGGTRPSVEITWYREDSTDPEPLTDATITGFIKRTDEDAVAIAGDIVVTDGPNGVFRWDLHADDVAVAGTHYVQFVATFPSGQSPAKTFSTKWVVSESL